MDKCGISPSENTTCEQKSQSKSGGADPSTEVAHIVMDRMCVRIPEVAYAETYMPLGYSES